MKEEQQNVATSRAADASSSVAVVVNGHVSLKLSNHITTAITAPFHA
jgi:hypothetical protein